MIYVHVTLEKQFFFELQVKGHGCRKLKERLLNIPSSICTAVSVLSQTFTESLLQLVDKDSFSVHNSSGICLVKRSKCLKQNDDKLGIMQILLHNYLIGIKRLRDSYPHQIELKVENKGS